MARLGYGLDGVSRVWEGLGGARLGSASHLIFHSIPPTIQPAGGKEVSGKAVRGGSFPRPGHHGIALGQMRCHSGAHRAICGRDHKRVTAGPQRRRGHSGFIAGPQRSHDEATSGQHRGHGVTMGTLRGHSAATAGTQWGSCGATAGPSGGQAGPRHTSEQVGGALFRVASVRILL